MFDWAPYQKAKGAAKLHLVLDNHGHLPCYAVITEGKTSEVKITREFRFAPGTILVFDRGYVDYPWYQRLTERRPTRRPVGTVLLNPLLGQHRGNLIRKMLINRPKTQSFQCRLTPISSEFGQPCGTPCPS
jgi:Transposase DDE domain